LKKSNNNKKNNKKEKEEPLFPADDYKPVDETSTDKFEVDDDEILSEVEKLARSVKKQKLISVFELIGKPSKYSEAFSKSECSEELFKELLILLEKKSVMIHFKNEYPVTEKCRFILEEIFSQGVDNVKNGNHVNFIYEDFHPEKVLDDEEPEIEEEF
jgi:hypothetical protein